jgi:hypothetical protein
MGFAGLWEGFRWLSGEVTRTFTIVTADANSDVTEVHNRMLVIIEADDWCRYNHWPRSAGLTEAAMEQVEIDYRGYVIPYPAIRRDTSGWTVNLSSNVPNLIARLEQPCMVITDGYSLEGAISRTKRYVDGLLDHGGAAQETGVNPMTVTVYRFTVYDITNDEQRTSRRWATREAIERVRGQVLEATATEVDPSVVGAEIAGMTERNFDPHKSTGFQRAVTL